MNERPGVEFTGEVTWHVTFRDGTYTFVCDVHPTSMRGSFTAGTPPTTDTTATVSAGGAITAKTKLILTSGPAYVDHAQDRRRQDR